MLDAETVTKPDVCPAKDVPGSVGAGPQPAYIKDSVASLAEMNRDGLRDQWRRLYRSNPPTRVTHELLRLAVLWKFQEKACGGPSAATKRRLAGLVKTFEEQGDLVRSRAVRLKPGARLVRQWRGETHTVLVLEDGFEWHGRHYGSLSAVAREITATRWSGPRFFGLVSRAKAAKTQEIEDA